MNNKKLLLIVLLLVSVVLNFKAKILSIDSRACAQFLLENTTIHPKLFLTEASKEVRHNASNEADIQLLFPNPITSLKLKPERSVAGNLEFFIAGLLYRNRY